MNKRSKTDLTFGGLNAISSVGVAAFGGAVSTTSGTLHSTTGQTAQPQSSGAKSQSFSLLGNYTPSEYLNAAEHRPAIIPIGCCFVILG
jgi:hypothetical protein